VVGLRTRIAAMFLYAFFLPVFAVAFPSSYFIAAPFALFFLMMLEPFMPVLLGADGVSVYLASSGVYLRVTDVCSLLPLLGLVAMAMWVRSVGWLRGVLVVVGLFSMNLVRVFGVAFAAAYVSSGVAAALHDFAYAVFSLVAVGIVAYCVISARLGSAAR
jgi:hypothetical protein